MVGVLQGNVQIRISARIDDFKTIKQAIKAVPGVRNSAYFAKGESECILLVNVKLGKSEDPMGLCLSVMDGVIRVLKENGVRRLDECPFCGAGNCDSLMIYKGGCRSVHRRCASEDFSQVQQLAGASPETGNYVTGLLGGIVGMVLGCVPSLLTAYFMNTIYALLFALIPICIYYGYKLARGRMGKATIFVSVLLTVVGVFFMNAVMVYLQLLQEFSTAFATVQIQALVGSLSGWGIILKSNPSTLLFAALGIWISWRIITNTPAKQAANAEVVISTLMDDPAYTADFSFEE